MKLFVLLTAALASVNLAAAAQDLAAVKSVYLMPMSGGLDQYLAVQLTASHRFNVVTDPQAADAVFTDHIGISFEQAMHELHNVGEKRAEEKEGADYGPTMAPLSRGKGSFFLVDHKTHNVIWSTFVERKGSDAPRLNRMAEKIVEQLDKDLRPKK